MMITERDSVNLKDQIYLSNSLLHLNLKLKLSIFLSDDKMDFAVYLLNVFRHQTYSIRSRAKCLNLPIPGLVYFSTAVY